VLLRTQWGVPVTNFIIIAVTAALIGWYIAEWMDINK
jgi:hypothetical protein